VSQKAKAIRVAFRIHRIKRWKKEVSGRRGSKDKKKA